MKYKYDTSPFLGRERCSSLFVSLLYYLNWTECDNYAVELLFYHAYVIYGNAMTILKPVKKCKHQSFWPSNINSLPYVIVKNIKENVNIEILLKS